MELRPYFYVSGVLLDEVEDALQNEVEDGVVLDAFGVLAVAEVVDGFGLAPQVRLEAVDLALIQVIPEDGQLLLDEDLVEVPDGADVRRGGGAVDVPPLPLLGGDDLPGEGLLLALRVEVVLLLADLLKGTLDLLLDAAETQLLLGRVHLLSGCDEVVDDVVAEVDTVPRAQLLL